MVYLHSLMSLGIICMREKLETSYSKRAFLHHISYYVSPILKCQIVQAQATEQCVFMVP